MKSIIKKQQIKKIIRISMSILLIASMALGSVPATEVQAAKTICETYSGSNVESQNYSVYYASPIESYLTALSDGTLMRVQYGSNIEGLLVEYYDEEYNIISSKIVAEELPRFGGFYATDSNYFVVTGQTNTEESDTKEVYRITKYDKNWNKIKSAGLSNCNTTSPFRSGSCRMDVCGKYLLIRTSHQMYTSTDGLNHQSNATIELNMETMAITDSYTEVMNINYGYVSHSFNQFIKIENNKIVAVDHGDAYPRSFVLVKYPTDVSTGTFVPSSSRCTAVNVMTFSGASGVNTTGASVGGFEISGSKYLVAGNSVVQDEDNLTRKTRNVFVASVDKSTSAVNINWLTSYEEGDGTTSTPHMVKVSNDQYIVLWSRDNIVYYTSVNGSGVQSDEIYSLEGNLSDCVPVVLNNKLVWYTWMENINTFYDINVNDLSQNNKTEIINGHQYESSGAVDGVVDLKCTICQQEKQERVATSMTIWWNNEGSAISSTGLTTTRQIGDKINYRIIPSSNNDNDELEINGEMEVTSSDPTVASIHMDSYKTGSILIKDVGTAKITIRPKYNPDYYRTYNLKVMGPLKIKSFTVDEGASITYGEVANLNVNAAGGEGTLQYKFYETREDGTTNILRDYSRDATYEWKPDLAGTRTLYVDVEDEEGTVLTSSIDDFIVNKAQAPIYDDITLTYCYVIGAENQILEFGEDLPEDIGSAIYRVTVSNHSLVFDGLSVSSSGTVTYSVKNTGAIGDVATITMKIQTSNYETIIKTVHIELVDKFAVMPKEGSEPKIKGSNELTYGQKLSKLSLDKDVAEFVAENGETVKGTLSFENPDVVPTADETSATWIFVPDKPEYSSCIGTVDIVVNKATPVLRGATSPERAYSPGMQLGDIPLNPGIATATIAGEEQEIYGTWEWSNPEIAVYAGIENYSVVFIPDDSTNFNRAETEVRVKLNRAIPYFSERPQAEAITYGQSLSDSVLTGETPKVGSTVVEGTYQWVDSGIQPTVLDSQRTLYDVKFVPTDTSNYDTVLCKVTLTVHPAEKAPNMPSSQMNVSNSVSQVSQIELPEGWSWLETDIAQELIVGETVRATAVYEDQVNYRTSSVEISIYRSACEHIESELIIDVEATCITTGIAHTQCMICGELLRQNIEIPITAHRYGDWQCKDETTHTGTCETCGESVEEAHQWNDGVVTKEPTYAEEGIKTFTCTVCGYERTENIEKLESWRSDQPRILTGWVFVVKGMKYRVTSAGLKEVALIGVTKSKKSVTIPATVVTLSGVKCKVTAISSKAFYKDKKLTKVTIGKNVKSIGKKAFFQCKKLKKITIKSKVLKKVGKQAIKGIHKKAVIKAPKKLKKAYKKFFKKKSGFVKGMKVR